MDIALNGVACVDRIGALGFHIGETDIDVDGMFLLEFVIMSGVPFENTATYHTFDPNDHIIGEVGRGKVVNDTRLDVFNFPCFDQVEGIVVLEERYIGHSG